MSLRIDERAGDIILIWPRRTSERSARKFVDENRPWIEKHRARLFKKEPLKAGDIISVLGNDYLLAHRAGRGTAVFEDKKIIVYGDARFFWRRLKDFLKKEAEKALAEKAREKSFRMGKECKGIRVIDPKTRWGSCGHDGRLMFSWRLILAPPDVMDYVVAHEVAHLLHMNHSKKFWALCASLTPDARASKNWLKAHGKNLMAVI
jgi:predicted metal-dependent hydrolase